MKYKRDIVRTIVILFVMMLLRQLNILRFEHYDYLMQGILFVFCFLLVRKIEIHTENNHKEQNVYYDNIDIMRYICAIFIIIVHVRPFLGTSSQLDLTFNNIVGRICVPFYFVITGYFVSKKESQRKDYIKQYVKSMIPLYLTWSLIYVPVILLEYQDLIATEIMPHFMSLPIYILPVAILLGIIFALFVGLVYFGIYYHLWYFPALLLSLLVIHKWKQYFSLKILLMIAFVLLLFGATETYYGTLPLRLQTILNYYYKLFFTTRNFLFFGLFYVTLGYVMGKRKNLYTPHCFLKLSLCVLLLIGETLFLQLKERLDSNILLSCIPLVYYLFVSLIYSNRIKYFRFRYSYRELSKYYYLVHPIIILTITVLLTMYPSWQELNEHGFLKIGIVIAITHSISYIILYLKERYHIQPLFTKYFH